MGSQHFGHNHSLISLQLDEGEEINCEACERLITEPFHGCLSCNYYLHDQCMNTPRWLHHPSHESHPLILLPTPTYCSGSFICNACGYTGNSFSLGCAQCEFDLHLHCASLPHTILVDAHQHELKLTFDCLRSGKNYTNLTTACGVCDCEVDEKLWVYCCDSCEFVTHLDCARPNEASGGDEDRVAKDDKVPDQENENEQPESLEESLESLRRSQQELQLAQLRLQMSQQQAQMIADIGRSMANLSG